MRVGVYGTARNEAKNLDAWLASTEGADVVVLNDTGSTDDTFALALADPRVTASQLPVEPMLLCNALNIAMSQLPDDIDLAIRLDLDERLQPGWRQELDKLAITGPTVLQPWFDHHGLTYRHDRIHTRHGFHWELPVHEVLIGPGPRIPIDVTIEHHQDLTKDRSQVLGELEAAHQADPTNLRILHYLGREYTYYQRWADAIPHLHAHAKSDAYANERAESWRLLGDCYSALIPLEHVDLEPYRQATWLTPNHREPWIAIADFHHKRGAWHSARWCALHALKITEKHDYFNMPWCWNGFPHHLVALAAWYLDQFDEALEHGRRAVELNPDNDLYRANLGFYEGALTTT